jgi:hypothetical protein
MKRESVVPIPASVPAPLGDRSEAMAQEIAHQMMRGNAASFDACLREARELIRHAVSGGAS